MANRSTTELPLLARHQISSNGICRSWRATGGSVSRLIDWYEKFEQLVVLAPSFIIVIVIAMTLV